MYTSYGLTQAILKAIYEGDQSDLIGMLEVMDIEVLADEIFNMAATLLYAGRTNSERKEIEDKLLGESTRYDFETLVQGLQGRFVFPQTNPPG